MKALDINSLEKGKYLYATWAAHIKVPGATQLEGVLAAAMAYGHLRDHGFKGMVFRSSN